MDFMKWIDDIYDNFIISITPKCRTDEEVRRDRNDILKNKILEMVEPLSRNPLYGAVASRSMERHGTTNYKELNVGQLIVLGMEWAPYQSELYKKYGDL